MALGGRGVGGLGALIRTANQFKSSDFPTPRGYDSYEQAVHPPLPATAIVVPARKRAP